MQWLTISDGAKRTGYSTRTLERYISTRRLQAYRGPGGHIRLRSDDLDALFVPVAP